MVTSIGHHSPGFFRPSTSTTKRRRPNTADSDDLITSRLAQIDAADALLGPGGPDRFAEADTIALMQSINAVRVVLGTILDVTDEDDHLAAEHNAVDASEPPDGDDDEGDELTAMQLYDYLSWLLEWVVHSLRI